MNNSSGMDRGGKFLEKNCGAVSVRSITRYFGFINWVDIREVKHDVNGRRQTAKITSDFESFSSKP